MLVEYQTFTPDVTPCCVEDAWKHVKECLLTGVNNVCDKTKYAITRLGGGMIKLTLPFKRGVINGSSENKEDTKQSTKQ